MRAPSHVWLILPAGAALLAGLDAALLLADLPAPVDAAHLPDRHGVLMVLGFLGTLIALERAVALRQKWAYLAPGLLGAGGLVLARGGPVTLATVLLIDGCVALIAVYLLLYRRQRDEATAVQTLAAVAATAAAVLWLRLPVDQLLLWLVSFIVLTIAAERVELARLMLPAQAPRVLIVLASLLVSAATVSLIRPALGGRAAGLVLLVLTLWLALQDVARRTIRLPGLPRLCAVALLAGYGWLAVAASVWVVVGAPATEAAYDTAIHAVFLGFAMSMVIAHAPVILPAIIRRPLPYRPLLWLPLIVLHAALIVRLGAGNLLAQPALWRVGSALTVAALLLLPITVVTGLVRPERSAP